MMVVALILVGAVVGYAATIHADFLIHRNIWHGKWKIVHRGPLRWLLYPHFVHHVKGHHRHSHFHRDELESGEVVPAEAHRHVEEKYQQSWNVKYGLKCTQHGITIRGIECILHYLLVYFVTPQPYIAALLWVVLGPAAGIPAAIMPGCAVFTQILHRFYHMTPAVRMARTPRWLRWAIRSREFTRLADEHELHHYGPKSKDDYYCVLPFGNRLLRPLLGKN